jgi:CMP-N,N'-diacetyllegionaminic acid synthase
MACVAIIPARGGSRGIPGKNLQPIGGVPLVGWTVRAALAAKSIEAVYVSTESKQIAQAAAEYGAQVIMRPAELAADDTPTMPVVRHALGTLPAEPEMVAILQCTSPLTTGQDIDWAIERLTAELDAVISVEADHGFLVSGDGALLSYPSWGTKRRQDREARYRLNGAVYVVRTPVRDEFPPPGKLGLYVMPRERSIDIDDPLDLHLAEALLRYSQAWIVCGAGPDVRQMLALARAKYPHAVTITTNSGIRLFKEPDRPDYYFLTDMHGCRIYHDEAKAIQARGSRLVTLRRDKSALKQRRLDHFDEFIPMAGGPGQFTRKGLSAQLSGLLCMQYALMRGARELHLVGMNGYTGRPGGDYYEQDAPVMSHRKLRSHTENVIGPFTQAAVEACPDVDFVFYGRLNYRVGGPNVRRVVPREESIECE